MSSPTMAAPLEGFVSLETHHCVTGSLRQLYVYNQHPLSEEMLLGIGSGVGFIYWHSKGQMPFIGGRYNATASKHFEVLVGKRTGVQVGEHTTTSTKKAHGSLIESLESGQPVMLYVDMGILPYFDFGGQEYHFGGHAVVACGWDAASQTVLIADRDAPLHPVPLADLEKARTSTYKPFPPKSRWFDFDFSQKRDPTPKEIQTALREQVDAALHPPVSNFGITGIHKAAAAVPKWPHLLDEEMLRLTMFNSYIFIDYAGGSGGGIFRYMFSRFLEEAAQPLNRPALKDTAAEFSRIGDAWQVIAGLFRQGWDEPQPVKILPEIGQQITEIAEMEAAAWQQLEAILGK